MFFDSSVHHTAGGTGRLISVSLCERLVVVPGDQLVVEKLAQEALDELCATLSGSIGRDLTPARVNTIRVSGDKLGAVLPRADDDASELPDSLVTID